MIFLFTQEVTYKNTIISKTVSHKIEASTHLEAFTKWCKIPSINDLDIEEMGQLVVRIVR